MEDAVVGALDEGVEIAQRNKAPSTLYQPIGRMAKGERCSDQRVEQHWQFEEIAEVVRRPGIFSQRRHLCRLCGGLRVDSLAA